MALQRYDLVPGILLRDGRARGRGADTWSFAEERLHCVVPPGLWGAHDLVLAFLDRGDVIRRTAGPGAAQALDAAGVRFAGWCGSAVDDGWAAFAFLVPPPRGGGQRRQKKPTPSCRPKEWVGGSQRK